MASVTEPFRVQVVLQVSIREMIDSWLGTDYPEIFRDFPFRQIPGW
jgi:hypothetical protein